MSYEKQNFVNDQILTADQLNHIEDGIEQLNLNKQNKMMYYNPKKGIEIKITKDDFYLPRFYESLEKSALLTMVNQNFDIVYNGNYTVTAELNDGNTLEFNGKGMAMGIPDYDNMEETTITNMLQAEMVENDKLYMIQIINGCETTIEKGSCAKEGVSTIIASHPNVSEIKSITIVSNDEMFMVDSSFLFTYGFISDADRYYWDNKVNIDYVYHDTRVMEEEPTVISFDGNLEGKECIQISDDENYIVNLVKVSDYCEKHDVMGVDIEATGKQGAEILQIIKYSDLYGLNPQELTKVLMVVSNENYLSALGGMLIIVYNDNTFIAEIDKALNKGIWVTFQNMDGMISYISSVFLYGKESGNLKKIDNKFIDYKYSIPFGTHLTYTDENDNKVNVIANYYAEAFNSNNVATGIFSHAEGDYTAALGEDAHAEGYRTIARGNESHAEGFYTVSGSFYQHVQGKYNIVDNNNVYAHIVGNGHTSKRSNAHTLDWNGNAWFAGKVTANGNPVNAKDLATKEYVDTLAANAAIMNIAHIEEIDALIEDNNINVLDYKYQRVEMFNNANIVLPEVNTFTEIHLFFDPTEDLTINLPECRKKQLPEILANKSYELVAIYNMNYWLVEINVFE